MWSPHQYQHLLRIYWKWTSSDPTFCLLHQTCWGGVHHSVLKSLSANCHIYANIWELEHHWSCLLESEWRLRSHLSSIGTFLKLDCTGVVQAPQWRMGSRVARAMRVTYPGDRASVQEEPQVEAKVDLAGHIGCLSTGVIRHQHSRVGNKWLECISWNQVPGHMGKRKTVLSLGGNRILEMYQSRGNSELQGTKQESVTGFCYRNNAEAMSLQECAWTEWN